MAYARYHIPLICIENGLGAKDVFVDGKVDDDYRIDYLRDHIKAIELAIDDGAEVIAYIMWGCVDLVSASTGQMSKRYGLYMLIKMIVDMEAIKDVERNHFTGIKK